jgi:hypothetical protein
MSDSKTFSWAMARILAEASERAYTAPTIDSLETSAAALVEDRGDYIVVAFQGSKSPRDFEQDAEFWMTDLNWSRNDEPAAVHHGFLEDWESIEGQVVAAVKQIIASRSPNSDLRTPIFVTGHSLGGALAILGALELVRQGFNISGVYIFGCPRVGNAAFRDIYNASLSDITFGIVNQNDIVPRTPPLLMGYKRVGQKVFLFAPAGWGMNPSLWMLLLSDALGLWTAYRKKSDVLITEHFIAAYQRRIQLLTDESQTVPVVPSPEPQTSNQP